MLISHMRHALQLDLRIAIDVVLFLPFAEGEAIGANGGFLGERSSAVWRGFATWVLKWFIVRLRSYTAVQKVENGV